MSQTAGAAGRNFLRAGPAFWLLVQGVVLLVLACTLEVFRLLPVDIDWYWITVKRLERGDVTLLTEFRPFGYLLLLKLVSLVSPDLAALPLVHLALRGLAVFAFYAGLCRVGVRPWVALVAASPLLYANAVCSHDVAVRATQVMSDVTGESLLILTAGLLLRLLSRPGSAWNWLWVTDALFFTYQVRAAYQFLVALLPVLGVILLGLVASRAEWRRLRLRMGLGLLAVSLGPYLGWCAVRLLLVGHWGLACFTGYQLGAVAGHCLTDDILPDIPEDLRPYVRAMLVRRAESVHGNVPSAYGHWQPSFDANGRLLPGIIEDDTLFMYNTHDLFYAVGVETFGSDLVLLDRQMTRTALAILRARPGRYAQWVMASLRSAPVKLVASNVMLKYLCMILVGAAVLQHVVYVVQRIRRGAGAVDCQAGLTAASVWELNLLLVLGLWVAGTQFLMLALVSSTSFGSRHCDTPGIFLTATAAVAVLAVLDRVRTAGIPSRTPASKPAEN